MTNPTTKMMATTDRRTNPHTALLGRFSFALPEKARSEKRDFADNARQKILILENVETRAPYFLYKENDIYRESGALLDLHARKTRFLKTR